MSLPYKYSIFFDFIESYLPTGFQSIHADDPIMKQLEELMEENDQFLSVMSLEKMSFLYTSKRSKEMLGIDSGIFNPAHLLAAIHPDDIDKLSWVNSQLLRVGGEMFQNEKGPALMSFTFRLRNASGDYMRILGQNYIFYSPKPEKAVFGIRVITNVGWCKLKNNCSHQYVGNDISLFRFPDECLLKTVPAFSPRELDILRLIEFGLSSKEIAEKLYLSINTVNTHRYNILKKSGKASIPELIYGLKDEGLI